MERTFIYLSIPVLLSIVSAGIVIVLRGSDDQDHFFARTLESGFLGRVIDFSANSRRRKEALCLITRSGVSPEENWCHFRGAFALILSGHFRRGISKKGAFCGFLLKPFLRSE